LPDKRQARITAIAEEQQNSAPLIFKNNKKAKTHMYQGFGFYLCISLIKNVKLNVFSQFPSA